MILVACVEYHKHKLAGKLMMSKMFCAIAVINLLVVQYWMKKLESLAFSKDVNRIKLDNIIMY